MVHRSTLCGVDLGASEHFVSQLLHLGLLGQLDQLTQNLVIYQVFGEIKQDFRTVVVGECLAIFFKSLGVLFKRLQDIELAFLGVELLQCLPSWKVGR